MQTIDISKSIFATIDPDSAIVNMAFNTYSDSSSEPDKAFGKFLNRQVEIASKTEHYIPDYRVCRFDMGRDGEALQRLKYRNDDSEVYAFVIRNQASMRYKIPLRKAFFAKKEIGQAALTDPVILRAMDKYAFENPELESRHRAFVEKYDELTPALYSMRTNHGTLLTEDSGYGELQRKSYLQYIADNYFEQKMHDVEFYRTHIIPNPPPEYLNMAQKSFKQFDRVSGEMLDERNLVKDFVLPNNAESIHLHVFKYGFDEYKDFLNDDGLTISPKNQEISLLIFARDQLFPITTLKDMPSNFSRHFTDIQSRLDKMRQGNVDENAHAFVGLLREGSERADKILQKQFGISRAKPYISENHSKRNNTLKPW